jgi:hypothetical protein
MDTEAASKLPRLATNVVAITTTADIELVLAEKRCKRTPKRFLTAVIKPTSSSSTGVEDKSVVRKRGSRWQPGAFVCQVCGRDCGYRQNLYLHMKRHVRRGEADSACLGQRRRRKRSGGKVRGEGDRDPTAAVAVRTAGPVVVARKNVTAAAAATAGEENEKEPSRDTPRRARFICFTFWIRAHFNVQFCLHLY